MKVEDLVPRGASWKVRLHEKGGKERVMPCHHALAEALHAYIDAAKTPRTARAGCSAARPGRTPMS
jgi:site-specific recombinase XerD